MSDNQPKPQKQVPEIDSAIIRSWLENQSAEIASKNLENEIRIREADNNKEIALASLQMQSEYLKNRPRQMRMNMTRLAWIVGMFLIIMLVFFIFLLRLEERDFANKALGALTHIITLCIGYWLGRRVVKAKHPDTPNGEIIDN